MRFTASAKWTRYANAAVKYAYGLVYVKKTTALDGALSAGTWTNVTKYLKSIPAMPSDIEYGVGQFRSDPIQFEGIDIDWWASNVFNATASQYIELKILYYLGEGSDVTSDTCYAYSGWIDKEAEYNELEDSVSFTAFTALDLGNTIAGEQLTAQYVNTDIDGGGTDGVVLPKIPRLFVEDAAIASYILTAGTHTITYDYNSGTERAKLDSGAWVNLSNGSNTLGNAAASADDTERMKVYAPDATQLPVSDSEIVEYVVVTAEGDTLPRQWFRGLDVQGLLDRALSEIGIDTVTFGTMECDTNDSGFKVSYIDIPPADDTTWIGYAQALLSDATDLWMGLGNKLYFRDMSAGTYTLKATLAAGHYIKRLWTDATYIFVYAQGTHYATQGTGYVLRHTISGGANSSEVTLTGTTSIYAIQYYSTRPGLVYVDMTNHDIREVTTSGWTDALAIDQAALAGGYTGTEGPADGLMWERSNKLYFRTADGSGAYMYRIDYAAGWNDDGELYTLTNDYICGAYDASEDRVYFYDPVNTYIKSHPYDSATETNVLDTDASEAAIKWMEYTNGKTYFSRPKYGYLYEIDNNVATQIHGAGDEDEYLDTRFQAFGTISGAVYGLDAEFRLYRYDDQVSFYVPIANFEGDSVTEAIHRICRAFNLVVTISSIKEALVYRRGNSAGTPESTGNTASITISEASALQKMPKFIKGVGWAQVSNGTTVYSYDGTNYNSKVLSDVTKLQIDSELIPGNIVKDLAKYVYNYWSNDRDLYVIDLGLVPLFQYEPMDAVTLTFSTTKITVSDTGVIYGTTLLANGNMQIKALL